MGLLKYSNGWGNLLMSLASMGVGVYLIVAGYGTIGTSLIATVSAAWFIPGAAKQVATSVVAVTSASATTPTPTPPQTKITNATVPTKPPAAG